MKKNIIQLFIFFCFSMMQIFAQNKVGWKGTSSGDYIIYKDASWKDEAYLGFLYYNASSIGTFLYLPARSLRITILFSVEDVEGQLVLTGQNITSPRNNDELYILAVNYLMDILPSLYEKKVMPSGNATVVKRERKTFDTVQFGSSSTFYYASFLPFFYLESISDSNGKTMLSIEKIGRIANGSDADFFQFEVIKPDTIKEKKTNVVLDKKAKKETINVEGIPITLDSQWTKIADNSFFMKDIAFLTINKVKDSSFGATEDFASSAIKLFSMSRKDIKLFFDKNELVQIKNGFRFSSLQYDLQTRKKIKDIKIALKAEKNEHIIISLTVDNDFYTKNKLYFDSLF